MNVTLEIKNADEPLLSALKSVVKLHPEAKLKLKNKSYSKKLQKEILQDLKEVNKQKKSGTFKSYESVKEAFHAHGLLNV